MSRQNRAESSTPARNTRARSQTPLPSLATKQSHAYGAQGKTNLHTQIRGSNAGSFAEEFTAATTTAASPARRGGSRQRVVRRAQPEPLLDDGDEDEEDESVEVTEQQDPGRVQTALGQGLGYGGADGNAGQGAGIVQAVPEPSVWRKASEIFSALILFLILAGIVYAWLPLTGWAELQRFEIFWRFGTFMGLPGYAGPPHWALEMWVRTMAQNLTAEMVPDHNMPEIQWGINMNVLQRLGSAEIDQQDLRAILGLQNETLDYLKSILPVTVVLQEGQEQRYVIPQHFWQALSQRIASGGDEVAPLWDGFISSNERKILELSFNAAEKIVADAAQENRLITKDAFVQALEEHNSDLAERYTLDFRRMWEQNFETVRTVARETTEQTMEKFSTISMVKKQLEVLSNAVDLQNTFEALRTYNWFAYGAGAFINPHLTSATAEPTSTSWFSNFWGKSGPLSFTQNPPATVLLPWTEVTECWCAAPSQDGSAQISMIMTEPLYPERFIIEHIPAGGTRSIANAPRTIEVWADVGSTAEAKRLSEVMQEVIPYPSQQDCTKQPSKTHICLARGEYDIHHYNHVQSLPIWTHAESIGLAVNSFTIRIVNNWGGQRTCLYRLRMVGNAIEEQEEITIEQ